MQKSSIRPPPMVCPAVTQPSLALGAEKAPNQFDTVTVTATRTEQTLDQVPSTVSVQTERDIDQQNIKNIKDLVRYSPAYRSAAAAIVLACLALPFAVSAATVC